MQEGKTQEGQSQEERGGSELNLRIRRLMNNSHQQDVLLMFGLREATRNQSWQAWGYGSFEAWCQTLGYDPTAVQIGVRAVDEFLSAGCDQAALVEAGLPLLIALRNAIESEGSSWNPRRRSILLQLARDAALLPGEVLDPAKIMPLLEAAKQQRKLSLPGKPTANQSELVPNPAASDRPIPTVTDTADAAALRVTLGLISSQILAGPPSRWPDPPAKFSIRPEIWNELVMTVHIGQRALITGPTGSGKSLLIKLLASALQRPYFAFNFGGTLDPRSELLGTTQLRSGQTTFCDAHFLKALQTPGAIIVLDELNRCDGMFLNLLNPVLDGQRSLVVGERLDAPEVQVAPGVTFFAIANLGPEYAHTVQLDRAIVDRFDIKLELDYPSQNDEKRLLMQHFPRLDSMEALSLARLAAQQRELARKKEYDMYISTRMLFAAAARISHGSPLLRAVESTITNSFSSVGDSNSKRLKFQLLAQKLLRSAA